MRILHIGKYFPPVPGGMERFLGDLVAAQRRAGNDVAVLVHQEPGRRLLGNEPPWLMRSPTWFKALFAPISPAFPFWLSRAIAKYKPQVLHIHMPNPSAFWALASPAARSIPWIVHWQSDVEQSKRGVRLAYPWYRIFERALLERCERVIATSREYLAASRPLAEWREKCDVIALGVDPERLPDVPQSQTQGLWQGKGLRVLAVGRLTYYKGFDTLVRAVIGDDDKELIIAGEGEERATLERIIRESHQRPAARLLGEVDDTTLHRLMASCDVLCLPSRERTESFGIVLMEGMRYGKPLVVSDLKGSGVTFAARHNQNALLVPPMDVAAWRSALTTLANSPAKRQMLGHLGQERYRREFDVNRVARSIEQVYEHALLVQARETMARLVPISDVGEGDDGARPRGFPDRLLVVIPALNEAEDIGAVIDQIRGHANIDVLVIDDGSTDETAAVARMSGASVLKAPLWQGAWGAIQTGIRYALRHGYSGVVTMDADGQHEPGYLPQLLEAARGADVVIAACPSRGSRMRHIAWKYFRFLTGFELDDLTSGFRYYNARACRLLAMEEATLLDYQDVGVLLLLRHAHFRIAEIPVAMNPRKHGASRVFSSWWTVAVYMAETSLLCLARWNQNPRRPAELREIGK
ncbi:MAG TPA: glycosyltransferase [Usitatibacter sp.]|nr:glycosyltransferase [Usitatibacter sp.]